MPHAALVVALVTIFSVGIVGQGIIDLVTDPETFWDLMSMIPCHLKK